MLGRASVLQHSPGSNVGHDLYGEFMNSWDKIVLPCNSCSVIN
jgi:hypothetical protein